MHAKGLMQNAYKEIKWEWPRMKSKSSLLNSLGVAAAFGCLPTLLMAETAATSTATSPPTDSGVQLMEVVVTAQRHEEKLQDVPISVNAIGGETLQSRGVTDALTLGEMVPGLALTQ